MGFLWLFCSSFSRIFLCFMCFLGVFAPNFLGFSCGFNGFLGVF